MRNKRPDKTDFKILHLLCEDSNMSNGDVSAQINLSETAVRKRKKKLEEQGIISRYSVDIELPYDIGRYFVTIELYDQTPDTLEIVEQQLQDLPEIVEAHLITGGFTYLLKVAIHMDNRLEGFLQKIGSIHKFKSSRTFNVVSTAKNIRSHEAVIGQVIKGKSLFEN